MSMNFDLAKVLTTVGPAASIIFAAWIFVAFLQTRHDAAVDRYRELIDKFRTAEHSVSREANMRNEILHYKRRCEPMNRATGYGLVSAMLLISAMILGGLAIVLPDLARLKLLCMATALLGLLLVIVGAVIVLMEGRTSVGKSTTSSSKSPRLRTASTESRCRGRSAQTGLGSSVDHPPALNHRCAFQRAAGIRSCDQRRARRFAASSGGAAAPAGWRRRPVPKNVTGRFRK